MFLLLIGIGLALFADSWTDNKREREEGQQYLAALLRDFDQTRENLQATIQATNRSNDLTLKILLNLQSDEDTFSEDELLSSIQSTFMIQTPAPVFGTYQDMVNSGDLQLLQSGKLRLELARFVSEWERYESSIAEGFSQWNLIQVPHMIANLDVVSLYLHSYQGIFFPGEANLINRERIRSQEFQNVLGVAVIHNVDQIQIGEFLVSQLDNVVGLIQTELDKQHN